MPQPIPNSSNHPARSRLTLSPAHARLSLLLSLGVLTAGAWALTLHNALVMSEPMGIAALNGSTGHSMNDMAMADVPAAGWSVQGAVAFVAIWTVMMAAMMLPAAMPMVLTFAAAQVRRKRSMAVPTWIFIAGYLLVWLAAGLLVHVLVQGGSTVISRLPDEERESWAPLTLGAVLAAAGLYQFTPLKRTCLAYCRSPLAFVALHWRDGRAGALQMGMRHGIHCLGCCWALFAVLVSVGVMSVPWMLLLTLAIASEKMLPLGRWAPATIGTALIALGMVVASGAVSMPWLTS